jgi:threonine aldolase
MVILEPQQLPIDLRSDTVTKPSIEMREVMSQASVGDDSYRDDITVKQLETYCAKLFEKEAALFTSTGTLSNQIAVRSLTQPGDEVILDAQHHIHYFESAQTTDLARVTLNACNTKDGVLTTEHVYEAIARKPRSAFYSKPSLVCIENTISYYGGRVFPLDILCELYNFTRKYSLNLYIDGARLLNACIATGIPPSDYARYADAVSLCFAKGLGAPFGSILVGSQSFIDTARKYRKWYGGALHQAGIMAAGALYALRNNYSRLEEDHRNARLLAKLLAQAPSLVVRQEQVETNIVMFDIALMNITAEKFVEEAERDGILLFPWKQTIVRAVTHQGVDQNDICTAAQILLQLCQRHTKQKAAVF